MLGNNVNFYQKNWNALKIHHPSLVARLDMSPGRDANGKLIPLERGLYDWQDAAGKRSYGGDPLGKVRDFWSQQPLHSPVLLVFYGMDLGYHIQHYFERPDPANRAIVIVERSLEIFRQALSIQDWTPLLNNPGIVWMVGLESEEAYFSFTAYFMTVNHQCYSACMQNIMWLPSLEREGPYYLSMAKFLVKGKQNAAARRSTFPEDDFFGFRNILGNMSYLAQDPVFNSLQGLFQGRPGIVVSSGPSLDKALPHLKEVQEKAVIIAAESAVKILLQAGITPHFVACLERFVPTKQIIGELPELAHTWLVTLPVVYPETVACYRGPRLFLCSRGVQYQWLLGDIPSHYLGLSVANMGFVALDLLGCDPIILIGQDLAYERGSQRSHAAGALDLLTDLGAHESNEAARDSAEDNWVEGNDGQPILTSKFYRMTAQCFEDIMRQSRKRCLNAIFPEYGMKISSAIQILPQIAFSQYCREPIDVVAMVRLHLARNALHANTLERQREILLKTKHSLEVLAREMLQKMKELSIFCFERPPDLVPINKALAMEYQEKFDQMEIFCFKHAQQEVIASFLGSFLISSLTSIFSQYYAYQNAEIPFEKKVVVLPQLFQKWFQEIYVWSSRAADLMDDFVLAAAKPGAEERKRMCGSREI